MAKSKKKDFLIVKRKQKRAINEKTFERRNVEVQIPRSKIAESLHPDTITFIKSMGRAITNSDSTFVTKLIQKPSKEEEKPDAEGWFYVQSSPEGLTGIKNLLKFEAGEYKVCHFVHRVRTTKEIGYESLEQRKYFAVKNKAGHYKENWYTLTAEEKEILSRKPRSILPEQKYARNFNRCQNSDIVAIEYFFFDIDRICPVEEIYAILDSLNLRPFLLNLVESSPGKHHLYFRLPTIFLRDHRRHGQDREESRENYKKYRQRWAWLNEFFDGDPCVFNGARIAQTPGYNNPKTGTRARLLYSNPAAPVLTFTDLDSRGFVPVSAPPKKDHSSRRRESDTGNPHTIPGVGLPEGHKSLEDVEFEEEFIDLSPLTEKYYQQNKGRVPTLSTFREFRYLDLPQSTNITGQLNESLKELCRYSYRYYDQKSSTADFSDFWFQYIVLPWIFHRTSEGLVSDRTRNFAECRRIVRQFVTQNISYYSSAHKRSEIVYNAGLSVEDAQHRVDFLFDRKLPGSPAMLWALKEEVLAHLMQFGSISCVFRSFIPSKRLRAVVGGRYWKVFSVWEKLGLTSKVIQGNYQTGKCTVLEWNFEQLYTAPSVEVSVKPEPENFQPSLLPLQLFTNNKVIKKNRIAFPPLLPSLIHHSFLLPTTTNPLCQRIRPPPNIFH